MKISKEMDFLKELETQQSEFLFLISDIIAGQESNSCMETLELMIERHAPLESVLRIFILFCLENGGMKTKSYEAIKKDIIQTYGFRHLITLANLEKASLIHSNSTAPKINKAQLRRALFLISEDIIEDQDVSYAYSGYTPSSVRIIQSLLGIRAKGTFDLRNIRNIDDSLKPWLSDMFDEYQGIAKSDEEKKIILIYFIGGCTFAEISCLRFLESQTDRKFVVLTDEIVNGKSLVKSFYPSQQ